ncbi:MAG: glucosamine-6-phosphate deaminase [Mycobacterium sp.]|nr:glucosamine-6-phosphate deaminase [Mycobacterium sp.]
MTLIDPGLSVRVYSGRAELGQAAGQDIAVALRQRLAAQAEVRVVFASAPSQDSMLESLARQPGIDWSRITAFHMDEYLGLPTTAPQRFGAYLQRWLFDHVRPGRVELIGELADAAAEAGRYGRLVTAAPVDLVCLGIGENGHIAFNDPPLASFADPEPARVVRLDERSRQQQVNDGCFPVLARVPTHAITLTIPTLMSARQLFCVVPGATKAAAVRAALHGPVDARCPASVLRRHRSCNLYLDTESARELADQEPWS